MDPLEHFAQLRRQDLEAAAAAHRLRCAARRSTGTGPSCLLRLYARLWWASRPRAAAWAPGLFDAPMRS
ncbi:hypothetical protein [Pseudonocardia nigra]|uniref:hypothetical protein n=1 Tax=Pseudonocardia nigra TaxID=1921578 RepID=UPI001C5D64EA|nr:hypothetical protein [Pseudonocardia nigra]